MKNSKRFIFGELIKESLKEEDNKRSARFLVTEGKRSRNGTRVNMDGWIMDGFKKNPSVQFQHFGTFSVDPDFVIGKAKAELIDGKMYATIDFETEAEHGNALAEKVWKKLQFGSLNAVSAGYIPKGQGEYGKGREAIDGDEPTYNFAKQELLEISVVAVPANPTSTRQKEFVQEWLSESIGHDLSVEDLQKPITELLHLEDQEEEELEVVEKIDKEQFKLRAQAKLRKYKLYAEQLHCE